MINRVKSIVNKNRVIFENFSFLSMLQVSNLLIFMLTIPYLFRVLGKENYGLVVFAQTIALYFTIIVSFGFNVTATRDISIHRGDNAKIGDVISAILSLKLLFFFISLAIISILIIFIPLLNAHPKVFYLSMLVCLSEALFPIWYFQGIEKMKYITFINVATRVASALLIFAFVKEATDYYLVPLFLGLGTVSGALIGLYIVFRVHNNRFRWLTKLELTSCIRDNIPLFISNVSSQVYVNANKLIVGSFLGMQDVAIYDIADKVVNLLKVPIFLVGQTLFPRISRDKDVRFVKKAMSLVFTFFVVVYSGLFLFSVQIIHLFSGTNNPEAISLLRLLGLTILPISVGLFFNDLLLVPFGFLRDYAKLRSSSVVVYLVSIGILIMLNQVGLFQLAGVIILVESFVLGYSVFLCRKNKVY
ncbi:MAG TPA: oligosaccharide flippase family protein [Williamwhitmania sp.]|nr:oligosaccharide flippase family protein [Williamwhitmania sp.]